RQVVDLLVAVVADIADRERLRPAVEGEAPGVAEAIGPDLVAARSADEWVVRRDRVRLAARRRGIDPEQLAQQEVQVLRVARRIAGRAAVAGAEIEVCVGGGDDQPAGRCRRGPRGGEEAAARARIGDLPT